MCVDLLFMSDDWLFKVLLLTTVGGEERKRERKTERERERERERTIEERKGTNTYFMLSVKQRLLVPHDVFLKYTFSSQ
jgi:CRISPR/Cas system CMR subunit Cmr6 (Cas7 group RAMP superfamily)